MHPMDRAGIVLLEAHQLYARSNSTSSSTTTTAAKPGVYKAVGIILAVCSGLFIGVSFVIKKVGLLKANKKYNEVAGEGYGYLKNAWWWLGMTLMILGEICNFVAYAFVDAILVAPFGALSVVVTTILSAIFLKERLSFVGKIGCFECIIGAVVIAINAPEQQSASTIQEMQHFVIQPGFLVYTGVVIVGCLFVAFWVGPRYGKKSMFVYLTICSLIGGLSVVATQGLGAAIVTQIGGTAQFNHWFLYVLLVFVICTLLTEIIYLNKALNLFNAALVTPTYYVYFTSATIWTSAILFQGFHGTPSSIVTVVMGFLFICSGVVLLQFAKSSKDVPDTAIFQGDLDQMRTIAEQEEPESEPRADTIRGGAAILRAISKKRTQRQLDEVKTIHSERMEPIGEDDTVYFDGLRRRKTIVGPPGSANSVIRRQKTIHPPLGMSSFPDDDNASDAGSDTTDVHPGFHFPKFRRNKSKTTNASSRVPSYSTTGNHPLSEMKSAEEGVVGIVKDPSYVETHEQRDQQSHVYGLPAALAHHDGADDDDFNTDTSYKGAYATTTTSSSTPSQHVVWDRNVSSPSPPTSRQSSLAPPRPPPHGAHAHDGNKRSFSFQNVFGHKSRPSADEPGIEAAPQRRPVSRSAFSYTSARKSSFPLQEEERLGLVKKEFGSGSPPPLSDSASRSGYSGVASEDDDWFVPSGRSESPEEFLRPGDLGGDLGGGRVRGVVGSSGLAAGGAGPLGRYDFEDDDDDETRFMTPRRPSGA